MFTFVLLSSFLMQAQAADGSQPDESSKVHIGVLFGAGIGYSGAAYAVEAAEVSDGAAFRSADTVAFGGEQAGQQGVPLVPLGMETRLHWGHLMVAAGLDWSFLAAGEQMLLEHKEEEGLPDASGQSDTIAHAFDSSVFSPSYWVGASGVLGQYAASGFGPRLGARWGRTGLPRGQQAVASIGWALQPPVLESLDPVRPLIDAELYGGVELPDVDSVATPGSSGGMFPVAGFKTSIGLMF